MPNYDELQNRKRALIRKTIDGSCFFASSDAPAIEAITDETGSLVALPSGTGVSLPWDDAGYLTGDGMQHSREVSTSDVTSFGQQTPTRSDITTDTTTLTIACQETKLSTIGLATGVDTTTLQPATGGEVIIRKPARPSPRQYRVLNLAVDLAEEGEIYIARFFPIVKITAFADQPFTGGDEALLWGVTAQAQMDDVLGYSESWHFGGPGWLALLDEMGFPPAPSA